MQLMLSWEGAAEGEEPLMHAEEAVEAKAPMPLRLSEEEAAEEEELLMYVAGAVEGAEPTQL